MVNPLAIVNIARVATNGGTLNLVMVQPLNNPSIVPVKSPASTAPSKVNPINKSADESSIPCFNNPAVIAPQSASTEPTDRSIPAVKTTNVMPTEMQTFTAICRITFQPLLMVKNLSESILITRHKIKSAIND